MIIEHFNEKRGMQIMHVRKLKSMCFLLETLTSLPAVLINYLIK